MSNPDNSFVQRMIQALAEIDHLITGASEADPNTPLALAPEVLVKKVRDYVTRHDDLVKGVNDYTHTFRGGRHA